jgi:hypothetical protein
MVYLECGVDAIRKNISGEDSIKIKFQEGNGSCVNLIIDEYDNQILEIKLDDLQDVVNIFNTHT